MKFPLRVKVPASDVSPDTKHEPVDVNVKFEMLSPPPLVSANVVVKA